MSTQVKFNLTEKHKKQGFTLTIVWGGGLSTVTTVKGVSKITGKTKYKVEKVQKLVQSLHNFSATTIAAWLVTPTGNHWTDKKDWTRKSERERVISHVEDYIHDQSKSGLMLSWYVE